jgi:hypothetical protein
MRSPASPEAFSTLDPRLRGDDIHSNGAAYPNVWLSAAKSITSSIPSRFDPHNFLLFYAKDRLAKAGSQPIISLS